MNEKTKPARLFSMDYAEAKSGIINAVNDANSKRGIPFYLLEDVLENILHQVMECAKSEREKMQISYQQKLAEYEKQEG